MHGHYIYLLWHGYEKNGEDTSKFLGVYSSKALAQEAVEFYRTKKGFSRYPYSFLIVRHEIDKRMLEDGFEEEA